MVLFKLISVHAKLYKINECKEFKNRDELLQYTHKEYIHKIIYHDYKLEIGDLPSDGVLKEIHIKNTYYNIEPLNGNVIPYGVEIIRFHFNLYTQLSTFPSTVHTAKGVSFDENYSNKHVNNNYKMESISFIKCPKLTYNKENKKNFKLPNTLKELNFPDYWGNEGLVLRKGDISYGVEKLSMIGYRLIKNLPKDVLPNSIKQLEISVNDKSYLERGILTWFSNGLFNCLPIHLETLTVHLQNNCIISPNSLLVTCTKLKSLSIIVFRPTSILKANSLPVSLSKLFINNVSNLKIKINSIPSNVK